MYSGSNPTAVRSSRQVEAALLRLMEEKPFEEIVMKEICYESGISRQTVYNLFTGKEDILHSYLHHCVESVFGRTISREDFSLEHMLTACMTVLGENEKQMRIIIRAGLEDMITKEIFRGVSSLVQYLPSSISSEVRDYAVSYISGAFAHTLICWFRKEKGTDTAKLRSFLERAFPADLSGFLSSTL